MKKCVSRPRREFHRTAVRTARSMPNHAFIWKVIFLRNRLFDAIPSDPQGAARRDERNYVDGDEVEDLEGGSFEAKQCT